MVQNSKTVDLLKRFNDGEIDAKDKKAKRTVQKDFDASAKNQALNKHVFLEKYGFQTEIPTFYLLDAKIFPSDARYSLKVVKYVVPEISPDVFDLNNGQLTQTSYQEIYSDHKYLKDHSVLQLIKIDERLNRVSVEKEVIIEYSWNVGIEFSPNGKFFALFRKALNQLQIYKVDEISTLLDKVERGESYKHFDCMVQLKDAQKLQFDKNNYYLTSYGLQGVNIIDLKDPNNDPPHFVMIDHNQYEKIVDLQFVSTSHGNYRCDLVCKAQGNQILQVCKITCNDFVPDVTPTPDKKRNLSYLNADTSELQAKISQDFESIMLTNGVENYYFGREGDKEEYYQRGITSLNKKNLNYILPEGNNFYFITSKDFDDNIKVQLNSDDKFELDIPKKIQPGILLVHDAVIKDGKIIILISVGEQFNIEILNLNDVKKDPVSIQQDFFNQQIMWPYVLQQGFREFFWIINAFQPNIVQRIFLPGQRFMLMDFFFYDFKIYFLQYSTEKSLYQLWQIDMKATSSKIVQKMTKVFEYKSEEVGDRPFLDFFVRGESREKDQQKNLKLIVFFLHQGKLYHWIRGRSLQEQSDTNSQKLHFVSKNEFLFRKDDKKHMFCLKKVEIMFSYFEVQSYFHEKLMPDCQIKAYAFDQEAKMLITLNKKSQRKSYEQRIIKIFDLESGKQLIQFNTENTQIIGRIVSGLFRLVNGHFYFGNQVIKVRYDLIKKTQSISLNEEQILDQYDNLFDMQGGQEILAENPMLCVEFNRMAYISVNPRKFLPKKLMVIPFMHERKIYLNKQKPGHRYFYTTIEEVPEDQIFDAQNQFVNAWGNKAADSSRYIISMDIDGDMYYVMSDKGIFQNKVKFGHLVEQYGKPITISPNGKNFLFQDQKNKFKVHILCLGTKEMHFVKTIDVDESISKYIIGLEFQEGLSFEEMWNAKILRQNYDGDFKAYLIAQNVNLYFAINDKIDVAVQIVSKQEQSIYEELAKAFSVDEIPILCQMFKAEDKDEADMHKQRLSIKSKATLKGMQSILKLRIQASIRTSKGSIFYVQKATQGLQEKKLTKRQLSFFGSKIERDSSAFDNQLVFFTRDHSGFILGQDTNNFALNSQYLICWNNFGIQMLDLNSTKGLKNTELIKLNFEVDPLEKQTYIKNVRVSSDPAFIMIVVRQTQTSDFILYWDLLSNVEFVSFEQKSDPIIFFDAKGESYIAEDDTVIICKQNLGLLAFDVKQATDKNQMHCFGYHYGHRFDDINHNWILLNEYLSLSFSYMTLVIRDHSQATKNYMDPNYIFDQEEFNFVINRKTCFTCDNFVGNDYEKLTFVLQNMQEQNPNLLHQLYYYFLADPRDTNLGLSLVSRSSSNLFEFGGESEEKPRELKITPLHIAYFEGNNRSINLILKYMSYLENDCSENIKDILPFLINQENFFLYMQELPFRTIQMMNKQTLKISSPFNNEIIKVEQSYSGYTDDLYFKNVMKENKENKDYKNYPVNIWAIKCKWILNTEEGQTLLENLLLSEKHELYECNTFKVIVEFLYMHYRRLIIFYRLPVYLLQLFIYFAAVLFNESTYKNDHKNEVENLTQQVIDENELEGDLDEWISKMNLNDIIKNTSKYNMDSRSDWGILPEFFATLNMISCFYTLIMVIIQGQKSKSTFVRSIWTYFDIFYVIMNGVISIQFLGNDVIPVQSGRLIQAILSIVIVAKLVYYTQLIDEIAPLVNIIIKICYDIIWFCMIFIIVIFSFSNSFYLVGQNQAYQVYLHSQKMQIQNLMMGTDEEAEDSIPTYVSFKGALKHVYLLALGEFQLDNYEMGDGSDEAFLWIFFIVASFFLLIHLLNMLIAIMGETFAKTNEIKHQQTIRNHLRFVIDNQWRDPLADQRQKITYLIAAFLSAQESEDKEVLTRLENEVSEMKRNHQKESERIMFEIQKIKTAIDSIGDKN